MALIPGAQLKLIGELLDLTGAQLGAVTDIDGANITQTFPVVPEIIRRGGTIRQGIGLGIFRNVHGAAGQLATTINPFTTPNVANGYSFAGSPILDLWLLGASVDRISGGGTLDGGLLEIQYSSDQNFFGEDDSGTAFTIGADVPLARWDVIDTTTDRGNALTEQGNPYVHIGMRVPIGAAVSFISDVAGAAATIQCNVVLGLFPEGLGQDGVT